MNEDFDSSDVLGNGAEPLNGRQPGPGERVQYAKTSLGALRVIVLDESDDRAGQTQYLGLPNGNRVAFTPLSSQAFYDSLRIQGMVR